jgi:hypothetical protein
MTRLSPDARAVVCALDALTTQVRRLADAHQTPTDAFGDALPTTPRCACGDPIELRGDPMHWVHSPGSDTPCNDPRPPAGIPNRVIRHWGPLSEQQFEEMRADAQQRTGWITERAQRTPAADEDQALRWARREPLLVLLTRVQRGRALTEDEARTLRHHVETEMREADTARAVAADHRAETRALREKVERYGQAAEEQRQRAEIAETRAGQAEDLLRVAHETSNRSEAGRAAAVADLEREQAASAGLAGKIREQREFLARVRGELAEAQAVIERVRAVREGIAALERHAVGGAADAFGVALHRLNAALDGIEEQADDPEALRAKVDEATATLRRLRAVVKDWEQRALPHSEAHRLLGDVRDALAGPRPDGTDQTTTE